MMGLSGVMSVRFAAGALLLLGVLAPINAAAESWTSVVTKASKAETLLSSRVPSPPLPQPKPLVKKAAPAPVAKAPPAAPPGTDDITTGSIDSIRATKTLSPVDAARLFADEQAGMTTGAVGTEGSDLARGYCSNIGNAASDARIALQRAKLADVEKEIDKRIAALDAKTNDLKAWVERRDQFLEHANAALVKIYSQMEPDAAALQLAAMAEETSAAVLLKLEPQNASAILNEMVPEKAARLTATIAGAARMQPQPSRPPPAPAASAQPPAEPPQAANPGEGRS